MFEPRFFAKYKINEHELIKEWFFDDSEHWINNHVPVKDRDQNQSTDYFAPYEDRPYTKLADHFLKPYIDTFAKEWNAKNPKVHWWFADYKNGGEHAWHIHHGAEFAVVYQLQLEDPKMATELDGRHFDLVEGDMIIFPNMWPHRSPPNPNHSAKTIIAGNIMWTDIEHPKYLIK